MVLTGRARPQEPLKDSVLFDMSQPQLPLAEATPEDMTMAATIAAQRRATRIFLIDIGGRLLVWFPVLSGFGATCGSAALYYENVTIEAQPGQLLAACWDIRIKRTAPDPFIGLRQSFARSQSLEAPESWISSSSTTT
jgi:hypothetical protein